MSSGLMSNSASKRVGSRKLCGKGGVLKEEGREGRRCEWCYCWCCCLLSPEAASGGAHMRGRKEGGGDGGEDESVVLL